MAYLEELLPEFRKGAKIRKKRQDKRDVSDGDNFGSWAGIDLFILHVCKK